MLYNSYVVIIASLPYIRPFNVRQCFDCLLSGPKRIVMDGNKKEKLKHQEMFVMRSLLLRQNQLLGESLENLDRLIYLQKSISLLSCEEIRRVLVHKLPHILSIRYFSLFLYDKSKRFLVSICHNHPELDPEIKIHYSESEIMRDALTSGSYVWEPDFTRSKYYVGKVNPLFKSDFFVSIPLMIENEIVGVLNLNDTDSGVFGIKNLDFALSISEFIALSLSNALLYETTQKNSVTDGLTGLANRQRMQILLEDETARCLRYPADLSLVMFDVDFFKRVNDDYGHQKGDEVLMAFAEVLRKACRANDCAARYGGEEFILILPQTHPQGAYQIAERIREETQTLRFSSGDGEFGVTVSCGVGRFDPDKMDGVDGFITAVDSALYEAKESGRNKTVASNWNEINLS